MTDLFSNDSPPTGGNPPLDPDKAYLDELVGEGKKFKSNEELAKGKLESDRFITQLQDELSGLRQELNTRLSLEQVMDKINANQGTPSPQADGNQPPSNGEGGAKQLTEEDIAKLVEQRLSQAEKLRIQEANLNQSKQFLAEKFGAEYSSHLEQVATNLGVGKEFLNNLAKEQPKAFMALVGQEAPKRQAEPTLFTPPNSQQIPRAPGFTPTGDRKMSYYEAIKAKDPSLYWSPKVQNQLHQDAIKLGESFFDT